MAYGLLIEALFWVRIRRRSERLRRSSGVAGCNERTPDQRPTICDCCEVAVDSGMIYESIRYVSALMLTSEPGVCGNRGCLSQIDLSADLPSLTSKVPGRACVNLEAVPEGDVQGSDCHHLFHTMSTSSDGVLQYDCLAQQRAV